MTSTLERAVEPNEIVAALSRYGLRQRDIAAAAAVTERTVYSWKRAQPDLRDKHYDRLAAIRDIVLILQDSLTNRGVGQWLRAQNRLLDGERPLAVLAMGNVDEVRRAAQAFAEGVYL